MVWWLELAFWTLTAANAALVIYNGRTLRRTRRMTEQFGRDSLEVRAALDEVLTLRLVMTRICVAAARRDGNIVWRLWAHNAAKAWAEVEAEQTD